MVSDLAETARSIVRDPDPTNQLTFLRVKSVKHEVGGMVMKQARDAIRIMMMQVLVAPEDAFMVIVLQNTQDEEA